MKKRAVDLLPGDLIIVYKTHIDSGTLYSKSKPTRHMNRPTVPGERIRVCVLLFIVKIVNSNSFYNFLDIVTSDKVYVCMKNQEFDLV